MGKDSKIEWCDHSWNPWWGCTRVSPGCVNCYAESWARRFNVGWGPYSRRRLFGKSHWDEPLNWNRQAEKSGRRPRVFCGSMCDVFEKGATELQIQRDMLFSLIERTPYLIWLLLTKRPENIGGMVPHHWRNGWPANVWLGTSVENQAAADRRPAEILKHPVQIHFLSCEPLLEQIDVSKYLSPCSYYCDHGDVWPSGHYPGKGIDWAICGGESGPAARPMNPDWAGSLRDQCARAGKKFFFKQWGEWAPAYELDHNPDLQARILLGQIEEHDFKSCAGGRSLSYRVGKANAGRLLDGRYWDEIPDPYERS